jgi:phosphoglycerate kinase
VIRNLLSSADQVLIGGGMANTFFKAQGYPIGDSLVEEEALETARELLQEGSHQAAPAGGHRHRRPLRG